MTSLKASQAVVFPEQVNKNWLKNTKQLCLSTSVRACSSVTKTFAKQENTFSM